MFFVYPIFIQVSPTWTPQVGGPDPHAPLILDTEKMARGLIYWVDCPPGWPFSEEPTKENLKKYFRKKYEF